MEQTENKYITVAYKMYMLEDGEKEFGEEATVDNPFPFITGMGAMDEPFEGADLLRDVLSRAPWARLCCGHMHRPIFTAWAQGLALTVPSISMQIDLDLSPEGGDTFRMEMPGYMLHHWDGSHLNSHVCQIPADVDFSGPHPFADSVNPVED